MLCTTLHWIHSSPPHCRVALDAPERIRAGALSAGTGLLVLRKYKFLQFPAEVGTCHLLYLFAKSDIFIEMATQPALVQIDDWHIPDFIYEAEEELATGSPAQIILDSPPFTIPFDEDSSPRQSASERLPPSEEVGEAAGSPSPVIE